jgi:hypothetical protein
VCVSSARVDRARFACCLSLASAVPYAVCSTAGAGIKVIDARNLATVLHCHPFAASPQTPLSSRSSQSRTQPAAVDVFGITELPASSSLRASSLTLAVALTSGDCFQLLLALPSKTPPARPASGPSRHSQQPLTVPISPLLSYHTGSVSSLAVLRISERAKEAGSANTCLVDR